MICRFDEIRSCFDLTLTKVNLAMTHSDSLFLSFPSLWSLVSVLSFSMMIPCYCLFILCATDQPAITSLLLVGALFDWFQYFPNQTSLYYMLYVSSKCFSVHRSWKHNKIAFTNVESITWIVYSGISFIEKLYRILSTYYTTVKAKR